MMCGYEVIQVKSNSKGLVDVEDLKSKYKDQRGLTFEEYIKLLGTLDCTGNSVYSFFLIRSV